MPDAPPRPCAAPSCPGLVPRGVRFCPAHTQGPTRAERPRTSAASRGYGAAWRGLRANIRANTPSLCVVCLRAGAVVLGVELDHITPRHRGGTDDPSNLQWLCKPHHGEKTRREEA